MISKWIYHPFLTTSLCCNAISELYYLSPDRYEDIEKVQFILFSYTLNFYRISLQYMFVCEYVKLFEPNLNGNRRANASSVDKMNCKLDRHFNRRYKGVSEQVHEELNNIRQSSFYKNIKSLRDKKIAHSDLGPINNFSFSPFTSEEIDTAFTHLKAVLGLINSWSRLNGKDYLCLIPNNDLRTFNLVNQTAEQQTYYWVNQLNSYKTGQNQ